MTGARDGGRRRMLRRRPWLLRHAGRRHLAAGPSRCGHRQGHPAHPSRPLLAAIHQPALATGFARGFLVAAGIALPNLLIAIAATRVRRTDLTGTPRPAPAAPAGPTQPRRPRQRHV